MDVIDTSSYVSEFTKRTLEQFGWTQGDPVPADFGGLLAEVKERTPPTKNTGLIIDATLMQEADVIKIKDALAAAKAAVADAEKKQKLDQATFGMPDSVRSVYDSISDKTAAPQIIDDRATQQPAEQKKDAAPPQPAPPEQQPAEPPKQQTTPRPDPVPLLPQSEPIPPVCPRCLWDMRQKYEVDVTDLDKEAFVAITLGGERFKKSYTLLGDKFTITFRSLLAEENTIIHHQLLLDQRDGAFISDTEWFLRMFEYRLACSIVDIKITGQIERPIPQLSEVAGMSLPNKSDDKQKTAVVRLREYVLNDQLKSELTRRLVSTQFRQFQRLYEALEAMALEPNFW